MYCKFSPALGFAIVIISEEERQTFSEFSLERLQNILCHYLQRVQEFQYEYRALCVAKDGTYIYAWINEPDESLAEQKLDTLFGYAQKTYKQWKQVWLYRNEKES